MAGRPKALALKEIAKDPINCGVALLHTLATEVPPDEVAALIKELMHAETTVRTGPESWGQTPDNRIRLAAIQLYVSYMLGMPIQRVMTETKKSETEDETMERIMASPAMRVAIKNALAVPV